MNFSPRKLSHVVHEVRDWGLRVPSERGDTREIEDMVLIMYNPRDRVCSEEWRKMNIGFAIVDAVSHLVGDSSLAPLTQFVPGFAAYSTNGVTIDGSYGERIVTGDQMERVIEMLKQNPDTRRAVMSIYMGVVDLNGGGGLNTPCTLNLHFLVRRGRLNMKVMMRSNDVILGLTNDIFTFTMVHEYVSSHTGIPLGNYTHFASSFHMYESDFEKYEVRHDGYWPHMMKKMPDKWDPKPVWDLVSNLRNTDSINHCITLSMALHEQYDRNLFFAAAAVYHRKDPNAYLLVPDIYDPALQHVVEFWLTKESTK